MEEGEVTKQGEDFFFILFYFIFHFSKQLKFVLGLPKWEFSTGEKSILRREKNKEKLVCPSEKYSSYAPVKTGCAKREPLARNEHFSSSKVCWRQSDIVAPSSLQWYFTNLWSVA